MNLMHIWAAGPFLLTATLFTDLAGAGSIQPIVFAPPAHYAVGNDSVWDVEFGDFDHDGDLDMAVANQPVNNGRVTVWSNDGAGAFADPVHYLTGAAVGGPIPTGLVVADFNNDTWLDFAVSLFSPGSSVKVWLNDGASTPGPGFVATQTLHSGNATDLAAGDLNNDTYPDVVSSNSQVSGGTAKVFLNNGAGFLLPGVEYAVAGGPRNIALGDFDGDKDLDIAASALFADVATVLRNDGTGVFGARTDEPIGEGPSSVAAADLNNDGFTDIVASSTGIQVTSDVSVLISQGAIGFLPQVTYDVGYDAREIVTGDFDNDGDADVAVVIDPQARVFVLANNGDGTLAEPLMFPCGQPGDDSHSLTAADFDHDGRLDLAAGNLGINETAALLRNLTPVSNPADINGDGTVNIDDLLAVISAWGPCVPPAPCVADVTGDGQVNIDDLLLVISHWG